MGLDDKVKVIIAVGEAGYKFDLGEDAPDQFDIDLYELDSLKELAEQVVEEGLFGEIPKSLQNYIDYEAIAEDLGMDYSEIRIDGTNYIYRCDCLQHQKNHGIRRLCPMATSWRQSC